MSMKLYALILIIEVKMMSDLTKEVRAIGALNFEGNIIPIEWLKYIRLPNNKPDLISIFILSDIIYWYRPTTIRDEISGRIIGYRKKFKADLLQKGYKDLEEMFGLSRDQLRDSLQRLEKLGLIKRIFRNINSQGSSLANVMFIQIFPNKIAEILEKKDIGINPNTSQEISDGVLGNIRIGIGIDPNTYTEITTEITTKNSLSTKQNQKSNISLAKKNNVRENEMIKIWNDVIEKELGREINYTSSRGKLLNKRLRDFFNDDLSKWNEFCQKIVKSKFLMGEKTDFRVQLDWVLEEANLVKVLEGSYNRAGEIIKQNNDEVYTEKELMNEIQKSDTPEFWQQLMILLMKEKGTATFKSWIIKNQYSSFKNGILEIKAFSQFGKSWVTTHYFDDIVNVCKKILPDFKELKIIY